MLAPPGIEIGEPLAGVSNDCCGSITLAFPDLQAVNSKHRTVDARSNVARLTLKCFKTISLSFQWAEFRGFQRLDAQQTVFLPVNSIDGVLVQSHHKLSSYHSRLPLVVQPFLLVRDKEDH